MKTRLGICQRKRRFDTREEAEAVAVQADLILRAYKCALCHRFHLTSRTKGLRRPPVGIGIFLLPPIFVAAGHAQLAPFV